MVVRLAFRRPAQAQRRRASSVHNLSLIHICDVWAPMTRAREGGWSDVTVGADMRLGSHVAAWATLSQADNLPSGENTQMCIRDSPAGCFNAAHDVDRVGIGDIGDDQADEAGSAVLEAAGHQAGAVVELSLIHI